MTILVKVGYCQESVGKTMPKRQLPNPQGVESIKGLGDMLARALLDKKGCLKSSEEILKFRELTP